MVRLLARIVGVGVETADMLVREVLSRNRRDRRAVARYAGLTGSPDESGSKRREKGLAKAGNARVRRGLIQLAWRFLIFQKDSALAQWYQASRGLWRAPYPVLHAPPAPTQSPEHASDHRPVSARRHRRVH
jgi:transposase